ARTGGRRRRTFRTLRSPEGARGAEGGGSPGAAGPFDTSLLELGEATALEGGLQELVDALLHRPCTVVVQGRQGALDLAEGLELAEELHVAERRATGDHL